MKNKPPLLRRTVFAALVAFWPMAGSAQPRETAISSPRTVRVGVLTDNFPFSHRTPDGAIEGFVVDLFAAIEEAMALRCERIVGSTAEVNGAFRRGEIDLLQSFAEAPERDAFADFSVPYLVMEGAVFARRELSGLQTLSELRGRRVLVHRGSVGEALLRAAGLDDTIVHVASVEEAFRRINAGEGDATLASRLTGLTTVHRLGLREVEVTNVPVEGYRVRYCFAVKDGDAHLLARVNEGLAILRNTGQFEAIYRRWFGRIDPVGFTKFDVALAVAAGLTLALAVALWAVFHQRSLRRRLAAQARALQASEDRLRSVFESSPVALLVLTPVPGCEQEFSLREVNPAAQRLFGWTEPPVPGTRLRDAAPNQVELWDRVGAAIQEPNATLLEHGLAPIDGVVRWVRGLMGAIGHDRLLVLTDVTEEKLASDQLRHKEAQLRQTQRLEALGTLSSGIAHDFNNVLAAMLGNTELALLDVPEDSPSRVCLSQVLLAADRARTLVRQILAFSQQAPSRRELVALPEIVDETLHFMRAAAPSSLELGHDDSTDVPPVEADPSQVHQVLMNLCTNALQAMRGRPGRLTIRESLVQIKEDINGLVPGSYVRLTVEDTGRGMTPDVLQRIFEPFFTTKAPGEGTGLGLSVVHGIMTSHRGAVAAESQPGKGSRFMLYFPVADRKAPPASEPEPARASVAGARVMLLDDESVVVYPIAELLRRNGCEVTPFTEADAALHHFEHVSDGFDVVVCDLTMPELSGLDVARRLRLRRPDLPIILTSGHVGETERKHAEDLAIDRILDKPLTAQSLLRAISDCVPLAPP